MFQCPETAGGQQMEYNTLTKSTYGKLYFLNPKGSLGKPSMRFLKDAWKYKHIISMLLKHRDLQVYASIS